MSRGVSQRASCGVLRQACESLEKRLLLAAGVSVQDDGTLLVTGTDGDDQITLVSATTVRINGVDFDISGQTFGTGILHGLAGNDNIAVQETTVPAPFTLLGGDGNDTLIGGDWDDSLDGGAGDDTLEGGFGADFFRGGDGHDTADYSSRTDNLTIGIGAIADDGAANEHDNVYLDIETIVGGGGNDSIKGHAAGNLLIGAAGNDTLIGQLGNDTLDGGADNDTGLNDQADLMISVENLINGNAGSVVLSYDGIITVTGADDPNYDGQDGVSISLQDYGGVRMSIELSHWSPSRGYVSHRFNFADEHDVVANLGAGDDSGSADNYDLPTILHVTINGQAGNDRLGASGVLTTLNGGEGDDTISLERPDGLAIDGGPGSDTLQPFGYGGYFKTIDLHDWPTMENVIAGTETTLVIGTDANNRIEGGNWYFYAPAVTLRGMGGNDTVVGGSGRQSLEGGEGDDLLMGGDGDDTLNGEAGSDTLDGGAGNDTAIDPVGDVTLSVEINGNDTVGSVTLTDGRLVITGTTLADFISVQLSRDDHNAHVLIVQVGVVDPSFDASQVTSVTINSLADNDSIFVGGDANDLYTIPTTIDAGVGNDHITLKATSNVVNVIAGAGDDQLTLSTEAEYGAFDGGDGIDMLLDQSGKPQYVDLRKSPTVENATVGVGTLIGNDLNNTLFINGGGLIDGGPGNDTIGASYYDDHTLLGGAGDDWLGGGGGNDTLDGGSGADVLTGGWGFDTVDYSSRTAPIVVGVGTQADDGEVGEHDNVRKSIEAILGGSGNDTIKGSSASNLLVGSGGNDLLIGLDGNDTLDGGSGTDTLDGGEGNDIAPTAAGDVLVNVENPLTHAPYTISPDGTLIINATGGDDGLKIFGDDTLISILLNTVRYDVASVALVKKIQVSGGDGNDSISLVNLAFSSKPRPTTISGGAGNDRIEGSVASELILGGDGDDALIGNDGDDTLDGGAGTDLMVGGNGKDTADYSSRTADLTIGLGTLRDDGEAGEKDNVYLDIEVVIGGSGNDRVNGSAVANVLWGGGGNDTLLGNGGKDALFGEAGNDSLDGGADADYLDGGSGNDTLIGGSGIDQFFGWDGNDVFHAKDGNKETINGGLGSDKAQRDALDVLVSIDGNIV